MTQESALAWLEQFKCDEPDDEYTFRVDKVKYDIPTRQMGMFHAKVQPLIGPNRKCIRERIPDTTPAYFMLTTSTEDGVMDEEVIKSLAMTAMTSVLAVTYRENAANNAGGVNNAAGIGAAINTKVCIVLRSPPYTDAAGDEVESLCFLYPRLLVVGKEVNGTSPLKQARDRFVEAFTQVSSTIVGGFVQWSPQVCIKSCLTSMTLYGCSSAKMLARSFYKAYDDRGEEVEIEQVFTQNERSLAGSYLYSLNRLARRMEQVGELPPKLRKVDELLQMLSNERIKCESDLLAVSQAIFYESEGSKDGELMLEELLSSSEKAHELWCTVETLPVKYTSMTLRYMASIDNPEQFNTMIKAEARPHLWKSCGPNGSDQDVARAAKQLYGHIFAYSDAETKWYVYDITHWADNGEARMRAKLRDEMVLVYEGLGEQINAMPPPAGPPNVVQSAQKALKKRAEACIKWTQLLGTDAGKKKLMKEAADLFAVDDMQLKLDGPLSYSTFAFKDIVYNLVPENPKRSSYSRGRPEDWCRRSSPLLMAERIKQYSLEHPEVKLALEYLRQVLASYDEDDEPEESVMWYVVDRIACCLEGGNRLKFLTLLHGPSANNSKSTMANITHRGFGSYSSTIPMAKVIGKKRDGGDGPTPALSHAQGARMLWMSEASKGAQVDARALLELTSGLDTITLRDPHSKVTIEVIPSYKMLMQVNNVPSMNSAETGLVNRVRIAMFLSQYLRPDKVPKDPKEQRRLRKYPIVADMEKLIVILVAPFMWLYCERYKESGKYGPEEPQVINDYVAAYHKRHDVFLRFMTDATDEVEGASVEIDSLYTTFCDWHKRHFPGRQNESQDDLGDWLIKTHGEPKWGTTWEGIRMKAKVNRVVNAY